MVGHPIFNKSAYFEGPYRYWLRRSLNLLAPRPLLGFLINPSKADARRNDPTTTIMCNLACANGFGTWCAMNTRAFVATDPNDMPDVEAATGPRNDALIAEAIDWIDARDGAFLVAWGKRGADGGRDRAILRMLGDRPLLCLGTNADGSPRFPRAVKSGTKFKLYRPGQ